MKNLVSITLLVVMLSQAFSQLFMVIDYQANKDFIAEFLCINKSKPQLQCNGHCYLKKNLKKAEEAEKQTSNQNQKAENITLFCQAFLQIEPQVWVERVQHFSTYRNAYHFLGSKLNFHPPQVTV